MTRNRQPDQEPQSSQSGLLAVLCVFTVLGLSIADFANDGRIDSFLIGAVVVLAFGFAGKGGEQVAKRVVERWMR